MAVYTTATVVTASIHPCVPPDNFSAPCYFKMKHERNDGVPLV